MQAAAAVRHRRLTAGEAGAGAGAAARGDGGIAAWRPILQSAAPLGMGFYHRQRLCCRFRWLCRVVLAVVQFAQQEAELGGHPRGAAGFPAGDVGELGRLRGAAEGGERGVMGEDRLGGECRLDRLLRVERAEQVDGGGLVLVLLLGGVGVAGREGMDQRMQDVVGEEPFEGVLGVRQIGGPAAGCSGAGEGWSSVGAASGAVPGRLQIAGSSWLTSKRPGSGGGGKGGPKSDECM